MKLKAVFLFLFLFMFSVVIVSADYDVPSNYQKTEFNSSKWIQSYHNLSIDNSDGLVFLRKHYVNSSLDPSSFNVVGLGITTNNTSVLHEYDRLETSYAYYDFGTGYFIPDKEIIIDFEMRESSVNKWRNWVPFGFANDLNGYTKITGYEIFIVSYKNNVGFTLSLREHNNGVFVNSDSNITLLQNIWYYCTLKLINDNALLYIYGDIDRTISVDLLNITLSNDNYSYRYLYIAQSSDEDSGTPVKSYGESENYDLKIKQYHDNGLFYTRDLLENTSDKSVLVGINSTAATDTQVQLYGSPDNSTWTLLIDNDGLDELRQYREILYDYSSLYVRLNLTTIDPLVTPFVDELFYLHTYECVAGSETKPYVFIILFTIIGMLLGYAVDRT